MVVLIVPLHRARHEFRDEEWAFVILYRLLETREHTKSGNIGLNKASVYSAKTLADITNWSRYYRYLARKPSYLLRRHGVPKVGDLSS